MGDTPARAPWGAFHRVVRADGSLPKGAPQRQLLVQEGVLCGSVSGWMWGHGRCGTRRRVAGDSGQARPQADELRRLVPCFALAVAIVAPIVDPSSAAGIALGAVPVAVFVLWALVPNVPLPAVAVGVVVPVVVAQRGGALEPLLFDVSLLGFVVGRWTRSARTAVALGGLALAAPVAVALVQDPSEIAVGIWILGIVFPWVIGRAVARQRQLAAGARRRPGGSWRAGAALGAAPDRP